MKTARLARSKRVGRGEDADFVGGFFPFRYVRQEPFDFEQAPAGVADRRIAAFEPVIGAILRAHAKFVHCGLAPLRRHLRQRFHNPVLVVGVDDVL
jgi:hypothetical protein